MKMQTIRKRQAQRKRLARTIKHLKATPESQNKKDGLESLLRIAENYPKIIFKIPLSKCKKRLYFN